MSDAAISVQRLRLVAPRGAPLRTLQARVEDALRTSSKPTPLAQRFVLVRRLRLTLPRDASAQTLALLLEAEWRRIEAGALPIEHAPDEAPAVWAADELQARLQLLERWLRAAPDAAWFWRRVSARIPADAPLPARAAALLAAPWTEDWPSPIEGLLRRRLLAAAWPRLEAAGLAARVFELLAAPLRAQLAGSAARPPAAAAGSTPPLPRREPMPAERADAPASAAGAVAPPAACAAAPLAAPAVAAQPAAAAPPRRSPLPPDAAGLTPPAAIAVASLPAPTALARAAGSWLAPLATQAARAGVQAGLQPSAWAGLWLLLPLLRREGFEREAQPLPLLAALLRHAAARCDFDAVARAWIDAVAPLPPDPAPAAGGPRGGGAVADAARARRAAPPDASLQPAALPDAALLTHAPARLQHAAALGQQAAARLQHAATLGQQAAARLQHAATLGQQAAARLQHAAALQPHAAARLQHAAALQQQAAAWWRRARLACARDARLPLLRLLHRPGRVLLGAHRIDVEFALAQADIRIRRAGFDLDPGYLPWLDCIVHLHYRA